MIILGIDAHKRTHTVVVVDELGRRLAAKTTTATTTKDHLELIRWADQSARNAPGQSRTAGTCLVAWSRTCLPLASDLSECHRR